MGTYETKRPFKIKKKNGTTDPYTKSKFYDGYKLSIRRKGIRVQRFDAGGGEWGLFKKRKVSYQYP